MNNSIHITAMLDEPDLLDFMVERLAYRRTDIGYGSQKVPENTEALETSSATIYLSVLKEQMVFINWHGAVRFHNKKQGRLILNIAGKAGSW